MSIETFQAMVTNKSYETIRMRNTQLLGIVDENIPDAFSGKIDKHLLERHSERK